MPRAVGASLPESTGAVMGLMGLLTCRHPHLVAGDVGTNPVKRAQRPGEEIRGNIQISAKRSMRPGQNFHPSTSCAAPQPARSLSANL
jgi:hypothetical protein